MKPVRTYSKPTPNPSDPTPDVPGPRPLPLPFPEPSGEGLRLSRAIPLFLRAYHEAWTSSTRKLRAHYMGRLAEFLGDPPVAGVAPEDLRRFLEALEAAGSGPVALRAAAYTLRSFFRWAREMGLREDDPATGIIPREVPPGPAVVLSPEELDRLRAAMRREPDPRVAAATWLALDGLRLSEIWELFWRHVDLARGTVMVAGFSARRRGAVRTVALSPETVAALGRLREWLERHAPKTPWGRRATAEGRVFPYRKSRMAQFINRLAAAAAELPQLDADVLRRTGAVARWTAGEDEVAVRERLGLSPVHWKTERRRLLAAAGRAGWRLPEGGTG